MRINKYVARSLGVSRRQADVMIATKEVLLNGQPADIGAQVSQSDEVTYRGEPLQPKAFEYLLLHKPTGYVCSRRKQGALPTIYELLAPSKTHLHVAGRLDADSSGLLLLTNDGDYALQLTHPRYAKTKRYNIELDQPLKASDRQRIEQGVRLKDGVSQLKLQGKGKRWEVEMQEGRNRQIRRTFGELGYTVTTLHRLQLGPYRLQSLPKGKAMVVEKRQ